MPRPFRLCSHDRAGFSFAALTNPWPPPRYGGSVRHEPSPTAADPAGTLARARAPVRAPSGAAPAPRLADWRSFDNPEAIARWDRLAACASQPNPFYESWYLLPSLRALDPGHAVRLLTVEVDGVLAGLLPVVAAPRYYAYPLPHWQNWVHANCFLGLPLVERGMERRFWRNVLEWADAAAGAPLFLHLQQLPLSGPLYRALREECRRRPAGTVWRAERALLQSDLSPQAYLDASLSTKKRKELRRQQRRLEEEGAFAVTRCSTADGLPEWCADFLALERRGWKGAAGSALACQDAHAQMFTQILAEAAARGRLERLTMTLDGRPVAMLASFVAPPGAFSYKTAFDETYARYSPGVLLQCENLAMLDRADIDWVDSCAAQDHPMIDHFWRERRAMASHSIGIGGAVRRALFTTLLRRECRSAKPTLAEAMP